MNIAFFFDRYQPHHESREGNLVLGLQEAGASVVLIATQTSELHGYAPPFPIETAPADRFSTAAFWRSLEADVVLATTFLDWHFTPIVRAIKQAGKALVVRADSDGRLGFPAISRRDYIDSFWTVTGMRNRARRVAWRLFPRRMARPRLDHLQLADKIFIESPGALANLAHFLTYWNHSELLQNIVHIPMMTISDPFVQSPLAEKRQQVVAVGRWDDWRAKNTFVAARVLARFLLANPDYCARMVGPGKIIVQKTLAGFSPLLADRLCITGYRPSSEILHDVGSSQIFFMPSNWEGFPLAAGEALCMGCSVVGSPIESLYSLSKGGLFGTIAPDFTENALLGALLVDAQKWAEGDYDPSEIASFWRPRFNRRAVGKLLLSLAEQVARSAAQA